MITMTIQNKNIAAMIKQISNELRKRVDVETSLRLHSINKCVNGGHVLTFNYEIIENNIWEGKEV